MHFLSPGSISNLRMRHNFSNIKFVIKVRKGSREGHVMVRWSGDDQAKVG